MSNIEVNCSTKVRRSHRNRESSSATEELYVLGCAVSSNCSVQKALNPSEKSQQMTVQCKNAYLSLLVTTQLKVLASLDGEHPLGSAVGLDALKPQHNLLCSLGLKRHHSLRLIHTHRGAEHDRPREPYTYLFAEDGLGLSTITGLLSVVSPLTCKTYIELGFFSRQLIHHTDI